MLIGQLYRQIRDRFREAKLDTPDLDARLLAGAALGIGTSDIILKEQDAAGTISFCER